MKAGTDSAGFLFYSVNSSFYLTSGKNFSLPRITFAFMRKKHAMLAALTCCSFYASAQLRWHPSAPHNTGLPESVRVYETTDSLDGKPFRAFYLEADLKNKQLDFFTRVGNGKRYTPAQYAEMEGANTLAVINTTFFSFADNSNLNIVMHEGKVLADNPKGHYLKRSKTDSVMVYPTRGAFGISKKRKADVAWVYNVGSKHTPYAYTLPNTDTTEPGKRNAHRWKMKEAIGGGPVLLKDGEAFITSKEENRAGGLEAMHPRTAIGYTKNGKLIILVVEGRNKGVAEGANFVQMAQIFKELGCDEALNLDGGGSSCLWVNNMNTIKTSDKEGQRPVPAVFIIKKK